MILSPYRNPPYRSPTPKTSTSPPPSSTAGISPKRKRSESVDQPPLPSETLRIQTNLRDEVDGSVSGCDSPRSKVAEKFRDLDIDRVTHDDNAAKTPVKRKRLKTSSHVRDPSPSPIRERVVVETPTASRSGTDSGLSETAEIQETPQAIDRATSLPSAPGDAPADLRDASQNSHSTSTDEEIILSPEATPLPPSPKVMISPPAPREPIPDRALSPLQLTDTLSLDQAALTWQDSEITGHEIDASRGDDGLGINGIGFRPTPAMAYARSQKRKQQVREWNAREAREARQRRMDRRRRGGGGSSGGGTVDVGEVRRVVRFDDVP